LSAAQFENDGSGSHARHTDLAFECDFKARLLGRVLKEIESHDAQVQLSK
jgi:hypothetical protein